MKKFNGFKSKIFDVTIDYEGEKIFKGKTLELDSVLKTLKKKFQ